MIGSVNANMNVNYNQFVSKIDNPPSYRVGLRARGDESLSRMGRKKKEDFLFAEGFIATNIERAKQKVKLEKIRASK